MTADREAIFQGSIGFFWLDPDPVRLGREPLRGFVRRLEDGTLDVECLLEDGLDDLLSDHEDPLPRAAYGALSEGTVLLTDFSSRQVSRRFGGRASVVRFNARTIVLNVAHENVALDRAVEARLFLPGLASWMGTEALREIRDEDESGRLRGHTVSVSAVPEQSAVLSSGMAMISGAHWEVRPVGELRTLDAPVAIGIRCSRSRRLRELVDPLARVQDLLSIIMGGHVTGTGGRVRFRGDPLPQTHPTFWNSQLMHRPSNIDAASSRGFPLLDLDDLGGLAGFARWVKLSREHPLVYSALAARYRIGHSLATSALMESAAGVETWVSSHRRSGSAWASADGRHAVALGQRVGKPFREWVGGDVEDWESCFFGTYNALKHEPGRVPNGRTAALLGESGYLLLLASVLDRVAGSKAPSRAIFASLRGLRIGADLREVMASQTAGVVRRPPERRRRRGQPKR